MKIRPAAILALVIGVSACAEAPPPPPRFPDIRFIQEAPIRLDVTAIDLVTAFQPSFALPHVEHEFSHPPQRALENWVHDRLVANNPGAFRRARATILDASVIATNLKPGEGLTAAFTKEQTQRYDGHVAVKLEILDEHGFAIRAVTAEFSASRSIAEGMTLNDRDRIWYELSEELAHGLDQEMQRQIDATFFPFKQ